MNAIGVAVHWMRYRQRWLKSTCIQNYSPAAWFESDVLELTKAGYFTEYEIKLSRGDFFADAKKMSGTRVWDEVSRRMVVQESKAKHELLAQSHKDGPSRFYFMCPMGMVSAGEIPAWAGLWTFAEHKRRLSWHEDKKAPRLHNHKSTVTRAMIEATCYYRMHTLLARMAGQDKGSLEMSTK